LSVAHKNSHRIGGEFLLQSRSISQGCAAGEAQQKDFIKIAQFKMSQHKFCLPFFMQEGRRQRAAGRQQSGERQAKHNKY